MLAATLPLTDQSCLQDIAIECAGSSELYVQLAYPWGQPDTELALYDGPDVWQLSVLREVDRHLLQGDIAGAFRVAVASGHGVGKSTLVVWLIQFFMTVFPSPQIVVTANTQTQLKTKTWRELGKWHRLNLFSSFFRWTATTYYHVDHPETWFAAAIPWSDTNTEAFQGTHDRYVVMIFDEASSIPTSIWETAEGSMTTAHCFWFAFGNRTRNVGRFHNCFPPGRFAHRWSTRQVDSRTARMANKVQIAEWASDYGEDSDFFRIRVLGLAPKSATVQFIGHDVVAAAMAREAIAFEAQPKILGVDVARYGSARSVLLLRWGDTIPEVEIIRQNDTVFLARRVVSWIKTHKPDAVFIDTVGVGAGVFDLVLSWGYPVLSVNGAEAAEEATLYHNKRVECWGRMRAWLGHGGALPQVERVSWDDELCTIATGYDNINRYQLERKDRAQMRAFEDQDFVSPDVGDALAQTFAEPVAPKSRLDFQTAQPAHGTTFDPMRRW